MRIALYQPEIAGNVGAVLRTAACLGASVDLIEPLGFVWDDKRVARAAMDYIDHVAVARHADWEAFARTVRGRLVLATTRGARDLWDTRFATGDVLLFGSEGAGVPDAVHARADLAVRVPVRAEVRSLNLSVTVGIVLAEALRQTRGPVPGIEAGE
ncbi:MAG: tRNA ((34)-2-O)-methyltransferase [Sphingomonas bacterium]|uniref:tRNA (cytidine(34)-2'-O)-methyltransferase n=1 Tax=Sphingomonas bacterium TaxID=1895847 RepID=UPI0026062E31|nr:tRNA (cytidine(34)-2'-O)-methyltransferase [Sphingomonas bacterium]MDB5695845.1 tRNA ((34)-2-O)-methyltransferase [Sphingomonas bacterium]